jgi:hypothetical protein
MVIPPRAGDDRALVTAVGRGITDIVINGEHQSDPDRAARIRERILDYTASCAAQPEPREAAVPARSREPIDG